MKKKVHNHDDRNSIINLLKINFNYFNTFKGRNGKGVIYVWAAGNGGTTDNCNADGYVNSIYTVAITSVQIGQNAWYSEVCAPVLAAAYGGSKFDKFLTTTTTPSGCKSEGVEGTSYAAPIATGIVALTLEAK
ncbi:furin-like [Mytilus galloprovincialis]|uniref:furin-like n=1 Tax=Mytilus galloprovincialis TaxID=29158 RepID=UPI003F7B888A